MFRLPIFTWNLVVTSVLVLMAFPVLTAAGVMLLADRHFGAQSRAELLAICLGLS